MNDVPPIPDFDTMGMNMDLNFDADEFDASADERASYLIFEQKTM
jgi:hypothetical protein